MKIQVQISLVGKSTSGPCAGTEDVQREACQEELCPGWFREEKNKRDQNSPKPLKTSISIITTISQNCPPINSGRDFVVMGGVEQLHGQLWPWNKVFISVFLELECAFLFSWNRVCTKA